MSKGGISASTLLHNTTKICQAALAAGAKLQAVISDCGASNFAHHQTLQKLLVKDPDNAVVPLYDTGHKCRNILAPLRKGEQYIYKGILFYFILFYYLN